MMQVLCLINACSYYFISDSRKRQQWETRTQQKHTVDSDTSGHKYIVRFDEREIGRGACHIAYKGRFAESVPSGGPLVGYQCVVKVFKDEDEWNKVGLGDQWKPDLIAHKRAVIKDGEKLQQIPAKHLS